MKPKPVRPHALTPAADTVAGALVRDAVNDDLQVAPDRSAVLPPARAPLSLAKSAGPAGRLDWQLLVNWLLEDGLISTDDAERTKRRFAGTQSSQHPIVRLASADLTPRAGDKVLDAEGLTQWLAARCGLPYLRIDPLKVDVGRVAEIMSITYAERRHALPLSVGLTEVTIATCDRSDVAWVSEIEAHTRKAVKLVLVSPLEIGPLHERVLHAVAVSARRVRWARPRRSRTSSSWSSSARPPSSSMPTTRAWSQVVDWLWQYAFDQSGLRHHLEPRRERSVHPLPDSNGVMHTVYQLPPA